MKPQPKVSVCMITYGHEKFIKEAINGVLIQECNFEVELIIANDCSTDNTDAVIQNILENNPRASWIKYIKHEKNFGMMANFIFALEQCKGKYIALCEGDDYWTDPYKLQKQVDFLEDNPLYSACFHRSVEKNELLFNERVIPEGSVPVILELNDLLKGVNFISTQSCVFKNFDAPLPDWIRQLPFGDYGVHLLNAKRGKIGFIDQVMGVYRISISSTHGILNNSEDGLVKSAEMHVRFWEIILASNEFANELVTETLNKAMVNRKYYFDQYAKPLKLLFISTNHWVPWGGSEVLWSEVAIALKNKKPNAELFASVKEWKPVPRQIDRLSKNNIEIIYYSDELLTFAQRMANRLMPDANKFKVKTAIQKLHEYNPDMVVFSLGDHNEGNQLISSYRKANIPYVMIIQLAKEAHLLTDYYLDSIRENYQAAKKVYFVSKQNKKILETQFATKLINAEVISNPFPPSSSLTLPPFPKQKDVYTMAFVASLSANHKGHDLLFEVLAQKKWRERNLVINLYGHGPHDNYLRQLKEYYRLEKVIFAGFNNSLNDIWSNNQAMILCSRYEGQSLALLEAMSYSRMAVVTDMGDARELIEDGIHGFIAAAPTVKHIDEALERAWARRNDWEQMGELAGERLLSTKPADPVQTLVDKLLHLTYH